MSRAVIVAVGVNEDGKRPSRPWLARNRPLDGFVRAGPDRSPRVLGVHAGHSEAEVFWTDFLRSLADRGLRGVKLVIADDHKGLRAAARRVFNGDGVKRLIRWINRSRNQQRRRIHWMRNALAHAPAKQRGAVAAMLKTIFAQESKAEAEVQWDVVAEALREKQPKLAALMDGSREDVLAYMDFPREHWPQIASTNPLERVNKEIKRRSDVVGVRREFCPQDRILILLTPQRRRHHPPRRRLDARDQRRVDRRAALHGAGVPRPHHG